MATSTNCLSLLHKTTPYSASPGSAPNRILVVIRAMGILLFNMTPPLHKTPNYPIVSRQELQTHLGIKLSMTDSAQSLTCPTCASQMEIQYVGAHADKKAVCTACGTVIDV